MKLFRLQILFFSFLLCGVISYCFSSQVFAITQCQVEGGACTSAVLCRGNGFLPQSRDNQGNSYQCPANTFCCAASGNPPPCNTTLVVTSNNFSATCGTNAPICEVTQYNSLSTIVCNRPADCESPNTQACIGPGFDPVCNTTYPNAGGDTADCFSNGGGGGGTGSQYYECSSDPNFGACGYLVTQFGGPVFHLTTAFANGTYDCHPETVTSCQSTLAGHVFVDTNGDGNQDAGEPNANGTQQTVVQISGNNANYTATTNGAGAYTLNPGGDPLIGATYSVQVLTPPTNYVATSGTITTNIGTNNRNPNNMNVGIQSTAIYSIAGTVYNDANKDSTFDAGDIAQSGWSVQLTGTSGTSSTTTASDGSYSFPNKTPGTYTVTLTQTLPGGYSYISSSTWTVSIGSGNCSIGGSTATCNSPATGDISNLNFSVTNENVWVQPICGDARYDTGYNQQIPATADCGGTATPYAITASAVCSNTPGILFSGNTNPNYGQGSGASSTGATVGNSLFPELYNSRLPNTIDTSYSFVSTTLTNEAITTIPLTSICPSLTNCTLSELTPGGVYTTTAADGPVTLSVSNGDATYDLGQSNYTFVIGGDLTFATPLTLPATSAAAFISGGDIHVDGNVGESDWTSLNPDLEGFFSADKNVDIDSLYTAGNQCQASGQPKEKKLNIVGGVIVNAAKGGGAIVNSRDGCLQDLSCPTITFSPDPLGILSIIGSVGNSGTGSSAFASGALKTPYSFWQELNP